MAFIEGNGVLTEAQHGFRRKTKPTETALQIFIKSTQEASKKKKKGPIEIFLDLTKLMIYKIIKYYCQNETPMVLQVRQT
jgi:hypothetical protein